MFNVKSYTTFNLLFIIILSLIKNPFFDKSSFKLCLM
jgi:hypothetical protein